MKLNPESVQKILIVTLSNLGDAVLTLPVFAAVNQTFPKAKIHVVASASSRVVFENDERIEKILVFDKKSTWREKINFVLSIRGERYCLILDLRYSLMGIFGGSKYRNSYIRFIKKSTHQSKKHLQVLRNLISINPG